MFTHTFTPTHEHDVERNASGRAARAGAAARAASASIFGNAAHLCVSIDVARRSTPREAASCAASTSTHAAASARAASFSINVILLLDARQMTHGASYLTLHLTARRGLRALGDAAKGISFRRACRHQHLRPAAACAGAWYDASVNQARHGISALACARNDA